MGLNIISAASIWLVMCLISVWALAMDKEYNLKPSADLAGTVECPKDSITWHGRKYEIYDCPNRQAATANVLIIIASALLLKTAIISAGIACFAVCSRCGASDTENVVELEGWKPTTIHALVAAGKHTNFDVVRVGGFDQEI